MLSDKEVIISIVTAVLFTTIFGSIIRFFITKYFENVGSDITELRKYINDVKCICKNHEIRCNEKHDKLNELCSNRGESIATIKAEIRKKEDKK